MKIRYATLLALFLALLGGSPLQAADIYVLTGTGDSTTNTTTSFGKIDVATGAYTQINSDAGSGNIVGNLAWNSAISAFYVTDNTSTSTTLRTLTTSGTLSSSIGVVGTTIYGMAYRESDNTIYAFDYTNDKTGTIDTTTGAWTDLNLSPGVFSSAPIGGRYAMLNDTIYYAINGQIGTMGFTASSTFSQIGSGNTVFNNMVLASDGTNLYGVFGNGSVGNQALYSIDTATGSASFMTNISGTGLGTYFYGAGVVPVPEPSTYALAAIASGVLAFAARRRRANRS